MPADLWTAEDVELVAKAMAEQREDDVFTNPAFAGDHWAGYRQIYMDDAVAILAALAEAGRLLPAGSQRRTDRYRFRHRRTGQKRLLLVDGDNGDDYVTEKQQWWVGPWQPVQDTAKITSGRTGTPKEPTL